MTDQGSGGAAADPQVFERFREAVLADPAHQSALRDIDDWDAFVVRALELAQGLGHDIKADDLDDARRRAMREWLERWI